jgi:arylsulfatase A-like enzyme
MRCSRTSSLVLAAVAAAVVTAAAVGLFFQGCAREAREQRYNVLLLCVDTLRPDRLGYMGHARDTSPAIDQLAAEGVRFEKCYSVSGWTLPSMATILTGMYPRDHLATDFHWSMDPALPTMAGILRAQGYDTRAYVSHVLLKPSYGFGDGFAKFDYSVLDVGHPHRVSTAKELTDLVIADLPITQKPFFMWVHYFDPHAEYLSHKEWAHFGDTPIDRYDQEIAFTDFHIGRLIEELKRRKMYDDTIIVFFSDHGEEFGEHGGSLHETLYDEVLLCPLVIAAPHLQPGVNRTVVEQIDFLPTVLGLLNIPAPDGLPGRNVFKAVGQRGPIFLERDRPWPWVLRGVIDDNIKLFVVAVADTAKIPVTSRGNYAEVVNVIPGIYMFDRLTDPGETQNIYSRTNPRAHQLTAILSRYIEAPRERGNPVEVDEELNRKLRSLGYIR